MAIELTINGEAVALDVPGDTPLLWAVRDELELKGTKFGCGIGLCGACTVHIDGVAQRSCITTVAAVSGKDITNHRRAKRNRRASAATSLGRGPDTAMRLLSVWSNYAGGQFARPTRRQPMRTLMRL